MNPEKYFLCSHLISMLGNGRWIVANLERIWAGGATVSAEEAFEPGTELLLPELGTVAYVVCTDADDAGHFLDVEFAPPYRWSEQIFRPQHLTDPSQISVQAQELPRDC